MSVGRRAVARALACLAVLSPLLGAARVGAEDSAEAPPAPASEVLDHPGLSQGVEGLLAAIRKHEIDLSKREREVEAREQAVGELEAKIERRVADLEKVRKEVERRIESWTSLGGDRITQLSKVYAEMPAARASVLLSKLDLDLAVSVVRDMKQKQSAPILAAMRADRALAISRRLVEPLDPATDGAPAKAR